MEPKTTHEAFKAFIQERENIRQARESGKQRPWTNDQILDEYHFTNIRREDDRVSRYLFKTFYPLVMPTGRDEMSVRDMWSKIMLARFINWPDTLGLISNPVRDGRWGDARHMCVSLLNQKRKVFGSAYLQPEIKGVTRCEKIFSRFRAILMNKDISTDSLEQAVSDLCEIKFFGEFIAGQIAMDAMHLIPGEWSDRDTYAPMGPGSVRGLNRLNEKPLKSRMKRKEYEEQIEWLRTELLNGEWRALDIEHALCEFDKYERVRLGQGSYNRRRPQMNSQKG